VWEKGKMKEKGKLLLLPGDGQPKNAWPYVDHSKGIYASALFTVDPVKGTVDLVRLAAARPELRAYLLPLLAR